MLRNLFQHVLVFLVDQKYVEKLPMPWGIGNTRYIITNEPVPVHPNGKDFFYPVKYKDYTIETHYARDRGLAVLDSLCKKLEIEFEPVDV